MTLPTGRTLEVKIPVGIEDGKTIRLKGQGQQSATGGPAGDAMVSVRYAAHRQFHVDGRDLKLDLPVTLYEAILGGRVPVQTLDGAVEITLPPGANRGRTLRLRGKGLPAAARRRRPPGHPAHRLAGKDRCRSRSLGQTPERDCPL